MGKESRGQVRYYTTLEGEVRVHFPEGEEACKWCPHCVKDPGNYSRLICHFTREILVYPELTRGQECPLHSKE